VSVPSTAVAEASGRREGRCGKMDDRCCRSTLSTRPVWKKAGSVWVRM
jgi:hypothetical protein